MIGLHFSQLNDMKSLNEYANIYLASTNQPFDVVLHRRVKEALKYWRAMLVRREFERKPKDVKLKQYFYATLEKDDESGSCDVDTGCTVLWARNIPNPISLNDVAPFSYVGHATKDIAFRFTSNTGVLVRDANRFSNAFASYTYDYFGIKVYSYAPLLTKIKVEGYFEDPTLVNNLCSESISCFKDDEPFPIGEHMLTTIFEGFRRGEFSITPEDQNVPVNGK